MQPPLRDTPRLEVNIRAQWKLHLSCSIIFILYVTTVPVRFITCYRPLYKLRLLLHTEGGDGTYLRKIGSYITNYTVAHSRRLMSTTINADFYKTKVWISKKKAGHNLKDPTKEETMDPQIYGYCTAILQRPIVDTSLLVYVDELSTTLCSL